ncbi:hypothetical protein D3C80_1252250 [compost metagenome]
MITDVLPFNGSTKYSADRAHFAVDRRRLVAQLHPSGAYLVKITAGDRVEPLRHDRLEVVVECMQGFFMPLMVCLEPRHIGVVDELSQGREGGAFPALGDGQWLPVSVRIGKVLGGLGARLVKCHHPDAAEGGILVAPPGDHVGFIAAR